LCSRKAADEGAQQREVGELAKLLQEGAVCSELQLQDPLKGVGRQIFWIADLFCVGLPMGGLSCSWDAAEEYAVRREGEEQTDSRKIIASGRC